MILTVGGWKANVWCEHLEVNVLFSGQSVCTYIFLFMVIYNVSRNFIYWKYDAMPNIGIFKIFSQNNPLRSIKVKMCYCFRSFCYLLSFARPKPRHS